MGLLSWDSSSVAMCHRGAYLKEVFSPRQVRFVSSSCMERDKGQISGLTLQMAWYLHVVFLFLFLFLFLPSGIKSNFCFLSGQLLRVWPVEVFSSFFYIQTKCQNKNLNGR